MNSSLKKQVNLQHSWWFKPQCNKNGSVAQPSKRIFAPPAKNGSVAQPSKRIFAPLAKNGSVAQPSKRIFAPPAKNGSVAQLYSALDFGSSGWGLESLQGHKTE